jgi:RNA polymerase sigma-70 factor (ECF subfamily)
VLKGQNEGVVSPGELAELFELHLLVGDDGRAPRIEEYRGQGSLRNWARMVLVRLVLNLRARRREPEIPDALIAAAQPDRADPELEHFRRLYGPQFQEGMAQALASLAVRERALLRYRYVDGLSVRAMAAIYAAPKSSVARWTQSAERSLMRALKARVKGALEISSAQFESLARLIKSDLEITLRGLLSTGEEASTA